MVTFSNAAVNIQIRICFLICFCQSSNALNKILFFLIICLNLKCSEQNKQFANNYYYVILLFL